MRGRIRVFCVAEALDLKRLVTLLGGGRGEGGSTDIGGGDQDVARAAAGAVAGSSSMAWAGSSDAKPAPGPGASPGAWGGSSGPPGLGVSGGKVSAAAAADVALLVYSWQAYPEAVWARAILGGGERGGPGSGGAVVYGDIFFFKVSTATGQRDCLPHHS